MNVQFGIVATLSSPSGCEVDTGLYRRSRRARAELRAHTRCLYRRAACSSFAPTIDAGAKRMKALISHTPGGPETLVLENVADPEPKAAKCWSPSRPAGSTIPTC